MTGITRTQYDFLTRQIDAGRVQHLRGQSHLEAWDIRRHLIRAFGFDGFDIETKRLDLVAQIDTERDGKPRYTVVYRAEVRLSIKVDGQVVAVFEDGAAGDSSNQPSLGDAHDMAMKTALSQGLKRCAVNLGDQFGLCLYNGGKPGAVVHRSLVKPEGGAASNADLPADDAPVLPEPGLATETAAEPEPAPAAEMMAPHQRDRVFALFSELGQTDRDVQLKFINWALRTAHGDAAVAVTSRGEELTAAEVDVVIRALLARKAQQARTNEMAGTNA